jgi:hypothetical protein
MPDPCRNLLDAYGRLQYDVRCAVNIHAGNIVHLDAQHNEVTRFLETLNHVPTILTRCRHPISHMFIQHENSFPDEQLLEVRLNLRTMLNLLDDARHASRDLPDGPAFEVVSTTRSGKRGRPRKDINLEWLARMSANRDNPGIASLLNISARTVRRRLVQSKICNPGVAPTQRILQTDGSYEIVYNGQPTRAPPPSNDEVDSIVAAHLDIFPNFGRSMIVGSLHSSGQRLTRQQLRDSYDRLQGGPTQSFSQRRIHRRAYHVAGPNSLWHHDGQHGEPET